MTIIALLGGFILGAAAMAVYDLTHTSQVSKLGADIMSEFQKLKAKV